MQIAKKNYIRTKCAFGQTEVHPPKSKILPTKKTGYDKDLFSNKSKEKKV